MTFLVSLPNAVDIQTNYAIWKVGIRMIPSPMWILTVAQLAKSLVVPYPALWDFNLSMYHIIFSNRCRDAYVIFRNLSLHSYSILLSSASVSLNTALWIFNKVIPLLSPWGFSLAETQDTFDMSFFSFMDYTQMLYIQISLNFWITGLV